MLRPIARGIKPRTVVIAVSITGLSLAVPPLSLLLLLLFSKIKPSGTLAHSFSINQ